LDGILMYTVWARSTIGRHNNWIKVKETRWRFAATTYAFFGGAGVEYRVYDKHGKFVSGDR